ncbi:hypothetical protein [Schumannella sp. 10F1B-5-1]|nr:hypothetical protein [Schumannella sp. 10F1B-5-1]
MGTPAPARPPRRWIVPAAIAVAAAVIVFVIVVVVVSGQSFF